MAILNGLWVSEVEANDFQKSKNLQMI